MFERSASQVQWKSELGQRTNRRDGSVCDDGNVGSK